MAKQRAALPSGPAVYRLYKGRECIYVGCSSCLRTRMYGHKLRGKYDRVTWERCRKADLRALESDWIHEYKPSLNKQRPRYRPHAGRIRAKRFPRYVHGRAGIANLIHLAANLECYWWRLTGHDDDLSWTSDTVCGVHIRLELPGAKMLNDLPSNAVVCGRCLGLGHTFTRSGKFSEERLAARRAIREAA